MSKINFKKIGHISFTTERYDDILAYITDGSFPASIKNASQKCRFKKVASLFSSVNGELYFITDEIPPESSNQ